MVKKGTAEKKKDNLTDIMKVSVEKVSGYKLSCEANVVSCLWKFPERYYDYNYLDLELFSYNPWRVYYEIGQKLMIVEHKQDLSDITVGFYLEKHEKLKKVFDEYGGYSTIEKTKEYVFEHNLDGYVKELYKWNSILNLVKEGVIITEEKLSSFADMTIEDIYDEYECVINSVFSNADISVKSYDISHNIYENIKKWNEGSIQGIPYEGLPMVTKEMGGYYLGGIHLIGGVSNSGKSTFVRMTLLTSVMKLGENLVLFLNEEGLEKWQRELIVWVANNKLNKKLTKYEVSRGKYTKEVFDIITQCADEITKMKEDKILTIIPLEKFSTSMVLKLIRKYSSYGVKYFCLDTFKMDNANGEKVTDNTRLQLVQNMTNIYNLVKDSAKNLCMVCTIQLSKGNSKTRYLSLDSISESKNIVDVCSSALFIRTVYDDEYTGSKNALKVFKIGQNGQPINIALSKPKKYILVFIAKSREGEAGAGSKQCVVEVDLSKNIYKEVGFTYVPMDY